LFLNAALLFPLNMTQLSFATHQARRNLCRMIHRDDQLYKLNHRLLHSGHFKYYCSNSTRGVLAFQQHMQQLMCTVIGWKRVPFGRCALPVLTSMTTDKQHLCNVGMSDIYRIIGGTPTQHIATSSINPLANTKRFTRVPYKLNAVPGPQHIEPAL